MYVVKYQRVVIYKVEQQLKIDVNVVHLFVNLVHTVTKKIPHVLRLKMAQIRHVELASL